MNQAYLQAIEGLGDTWTIVFLVFVRVSACTAFLPGFGERSVPTRIKLVIALGFTAVIAPTVKAPDAIEALPVAILAETAAGLMLGLSLRLSVITLQVAGVMAAQATSLAQLMGGAAADPMPAIGHILVVSGITLAVMTGLHVQAANFLIMSYDLVPFGAFPNAELFSEWGLQRIAKSFSMAFSLAAPFVILSVIYNLALGAINKAMPQLMVAFVGAPLITAGGLFVLFMSAPVALAAWKTALDAFLTSPTAPF